METGATRASSIAAGALAALFSVAALAGPDEDYGTGLTAFRRGDMIAAMQTLRRSAEQGHAPSMVLLGHILEQGSFDADAAELYRRAAETGSADGEVALAVMLAAGKGVKRDEAQAVRLYESAAGRGSPVAINALAQAYISRTMGLTPDRRDDARASDALRRAAEQGYGPAVAELARAYATGDYGLAADAAEAARWRAKVPVSAQAAPTKGTR